MKSKIFVDEQNGKTAIEQYNYWNRFYGDDANISDIRVSSVNDKMVIVILYEE